MTSPGVFSFFLIFWVVRRGGGRVELKSYRTPYLRNCTSYDCGISYTCVNWWYLQQFFFHFFKILIFQVFSKFINKCPTFFAYLWFLLYISGIPQALSNSQKYLYTEDTSILYQHKDIMETENVLNKGFANLCKWFICKKLSIHFGEVKTRSILLN